MKKLQLTSLLCLLSLGMLIGCDSGPTPSPQLEAQRLDAAKQERAIFVKANGDYSALSPEDKANLVKLAGGEAQAQKVFEFMKRGGINAAKRPENSQGG